MSSAKIEHAIFLVYYVRFMSDFANIFVRCCACFYIHNIVVCRGWPGDYQKRKSVSDLILCFANFVCQDVRNCTSVLHQNTPSKKHNCIIWFIDESLIHIQVIFYFSKQIYENICGQ
jgi:hypothetical protein